MLCCWIEFIRVIDYAVSTCFKMPIYFAYILFHPCYTFMLDKVSDMWWLKRKIRFKTKCNQKVIVQECTDSQVRIDTSNEFMNSLYVIKHIYFVSAAAMHYVIMSLYVLSSLISANFVSKLIVKQESEATVNVYLDFCFKKNGLPPSTLFHHL